MFGSSSDRARQAPEKWQTQLNSFVKANEEKLAALVWGLSLEWQEKERDDTLGIDLKDRPHFVACSREAIATLNADTRGQLQEVLGIIEGHNPEVEVAIVAIGNSQIKLIYFQPKLSPPECFAQCTEDLDTLIEQLEAQMRDLLQ